MKMLDKFMINPNLEDQKKLIEAWGRVEKNIGPIKHLTAGVAAYTTMITLLNVFCEATFTLVDIEKYAKNSALIIQNKEEYETLKR
jgi:hypothetical protein